MGKIPLCINCRKPIEFVKAENVHTIDHWAHVNTGLQACSIFVSGKWAEPARDERWEKVWGYVGKPMYVGKPGYNISDSDAVKYYENHVEYHIELDYDGRRHYLAIRVHKDEKRDEPRFDQLTLDKMVENMDEKINEYEKGN